jgi:hypothetical protein
MTSPKLYIPLGVVTLKILCITTAVGTNNFIFTIKLCMFQPVKVFIRLFFYHGATPPVGQGLLVIEASRSHSDTLHSVGLLRTSDQPDAEAST